MRDMCSLLMRNSSAPYLRIWAPIWPPRTKSRPVTPPNLYFRLFSSPISTSLVIASCDNYLWILFFSDTVLKSYRPFAVYDHMVQKPPCWRANYPLGHPKQKNIKLSCFVLYVPVGSLLSSMAIFVPCDRKLRRAYCILLHIVLSVPLWSEMHILKLTTSVQWRRASTI